MTHYIAMAGLHGCLPQFCCSAETYSQAVDILAEAIPLGKRRKAELKRTGSLELHLHGTTQYEGDGHEYCEIVECDCDDPTIHNDHP